MLNEKRASDDETKKNQELRNIAPLSLQLRSYKKTHAFSIIAFHSRAIKNRFAIIPGLKYEGGYHMNINRQTLEKLLSNESGQFNSEELQPNLYGCKNSN